MTDAIHILFASGSRITCNAAPDAKPWIQLAPFGRFPTSDKKYIQVFNAAQAEEIVAWFNGVGAKLQRVLGMNCVPVWLGHPDFAPDKWPERKQLGNVIALRVSDSGLDAQVEWNAEGIATIKAGKDIYPSAAWDCDPVEGTNEIKPSLLFSVGMWRTPNIKDVHPVLTVNATPGNPSPETKPQTTPTHTMLQKIIQALAALGFMKPDQTSEDDAMKGFDAMQTEFNAMKGKLTDANKAKDAAIAEKTKAEGDLATCNATLTTLNATVGTLTAERDQMKGRLITNAVNSAIETGRISKADEAKTRTALNADFDTEQARLLSLKSSLPIGKPVQLNTARDVMVTNKTAQTAINAWTEANMKTGASYNDAFAAAKEAPELKGHWEVVNKTDA